MKYSLSNAFLNVFAAFSQGKLVNLTKTYSFLFLDITDIIVFLPSVLLVLAFQVWMNDNLALQLEMEMNLCCCFVHWFQKNWKLVCKPSTAGCPKQSKKCKETKPLQRDCCRETSLQTFAYKLANKIIKLSI